MGEAGHRGRASRLLVVVIVVLAAAGPLARSLLDTDNYEDDWCQHVAWTARYEDPALFPGDPHVAFFGGPPLATIAVRAMYAVAVPLLGPETTARTLGVLAIAATTWLAFAL